LVIWEVEIGRIMAQGQLKQNVEIGKTPSQPIAGHSNMYLSSQTTQKAEIGKIIVSGQSRQKSL
jgi:hypothetical protein